MKRTCLLLLYLWLTCMISEVYNVAILSSVAIVMGAGVLYNIRCSFYECCNEYNIPLNVTALETSLKEKLFGQHIAKSIVYSSIYSHIAQANPKKPLVLSFHGLPGTGKNYVANIIANALYNKGEESPFYHLYIGRINFPSEEKVAEYKEALHKDISNALIKCDRSLFVFDEVDKMPQGVLDSLVPFIDYTSYKKSIKTKSIFIFLSNTGSTEIMDKMMKLWRNGIKREDITLHDFEHLIAVGAFNEKGGFHKSDTIQSHLIDHHVPFLPMEKSHVIQCGEQIFKERGLEYEGEIMNRALKHITFGPEGYGLFSNSGCKRIESKLNSIIYDSL